MYSIFITLALLDVLMARLLTLFIYIIEVNQQAEKKLTFLVQGFTCNGLTQYEIYMRFD